MAKQLSNFLWCVLSLVVLHVVGGGIFSLLEREAELKRYARNRYFYLQMKQMYEFDGCNKNWTENFEFCEKQKRFGPLLESYLHKHGKVMEDQEKWTFMGSMFYVCTLVTTLGYGNFHPTTPSGQIFTVMFGLLGIPVMGYTLSMIGCFVVEVLMPAVPFVESLHRRILVLVTLLVIFIFVGGFLFSTLENWSYLEACYFATCTLLSIGFGDFLPCAAVSRAATMLYILLGLGVAASFVAILQIHVEIRGEHFAKSLGVWYKSVGEGCSGSDRTMNPSHAA